jgi:hypothetical protein
MLEQCVREENVEESEIVTTYCSEKLTELVN